MIFLVLMMTTVVTAHSMSYSTAHEEALFLSDKMAYELGLTEAQYEAVYRINLDYLMHISSHRDLRGPWWEARNRHLRQVLNRMQYGRYIGISYFHHPLTWHSGRWVLPVRAHYAHGRMLRHHPHPTAPGHHGAPGHHAAPGHHGAPGQHRAPGHGGHHHPHSRR